MLSVVTIAISYKVTLIPWLESHIFHFSRRYQAKNVSPQPLLYLWPRINSSAERSSFPG